MTAATTFAGRAREQALRVLGFAGASGTAALVEVETGHVAAAAGVDAASLPPNVDVPAVPDVTRVVSDRLLIGRVGPTHAVLVWLVDEVGAGATSSWLPRLERACGLLERMLVTTPGPGPSGAPPTGSPSGAPAQAAVVAPSGRRGRRSKRRDVE